MAVVLPQGKDKFFATEEEKERLRQIAREVNARAGIVGEPTMTPPEIRAYQRAYGVRAEDNIGSRELLRMRYGDDYKQDGE